MIFNSIIDFISRHQKYILSAHETPDGDAIGSEYAMLKALQKLGKEAKIFNADPTPRKFKFIDTENEIIVLENENQIPEDIEDYVLLILDTNDKNNIGQISEMILPRVKDYFIIDHHESEEDLLVQNIIQKSASSTAEILYLLFKSMNIEIDIQIAQALFMAIVYDTGSFIYPKTTAITFEIARDLVSIGVNPNRIHSKVYESNSISSLLLQSKVLSTLELKYKNRVAIQTMMKDIIIESGALYEEADQIINFPLRSEQIRVSIFFKENMDGLLRCSLRSKGVVNVAEIAQSFGGGGHKTAAGFKCRMSIEDTKKAVLNKLKPYFI